ncbi:MAG: GH25 family lysozyme [Bacteroidota bacterium]
MSWSRLGLVGLLAMVSGLGVVVYWLIDTGRWTPANPSPAAYPVRGIDVSRHQGTIAWPDVAGADIDFVYMKATEGGDWTDPEFNRNWREAGAAGLARGAYHFFTFCRPWEDQIAHAMAVLPDDHELPWAVDVEYGGNCQNYESVEAIRRSLDGLMAAAVDSLGYVPLLYAVHDGYPDFVKGRYPEATLWLQNILGEPSTGVSGRDWTVWQYSVRGRLPGIEGPVDLNVFNGDDVAFEAFRLR